MQFLLGKSYRVRITRALLPWVQMFPEQLLDGHAQDVFVIVCGEKPSDTPTVISPRGRLDSEMEFKQLVQKLVADACASPKRSAARSIELNDVVRTLRSMPQTAGFSVLNKCGLA